MINIKNVRKTYGSKDNPTSAINNVSLKINDGDFIVLLGASGSGKSTFLNVVSGLERPDSGIVEYDGKKIHNSIELQAAISDSNIGSTAHLKVIRESKIKSIDTQDDSIDKIDN